jgi:hypothetical protein
MALLYRGTAACSFGDINPPPSSEQFLNYQYYILSPQLDINIGSFTGNLCGGSFTYRISGIKDASGAV